MSDTNIETNPLAGYMSEEKMSSLRHRSKRTLRQERQRGDGPPYVKHGNEILYPIQD